MAFPPLPAAGYEADDVLATLARELRSEGEALLVVTGDLDLLQCAVGPTRVYAVGRGTQGRTYDQAAVWARFGVAPGELPDWKALVGDVTDEIPGVPGIGAKTASALVRRFGSVAGAAGAGDRAPPGAAARDHPRPGGPELPLWRELDPFARRRALCRRGRAGRRCTARPAPREPGRCSRRWSSRSLLPRLDALPVAPD